MAEKKLTKPTEPKPTMQKELVVVMVISILLGLGGGYALGASQNDSVAVVTTIPSEKMEHAHGMHDVSADQAPKVELVVSEDAKSGYNVKIITTDFTFTPETVNEANVLGDGHAHLYVDGVKVGRLYSPYYHYDGDFEGTKTFRVTLNTNNHSEYAVDGEVISSEVQVTHDASDPAHNGSHMMDEHKKEDGEHMNGDDHMHSDM
jgi:hypothetical protein